ncbi:hypothetical protein K3718_01330 [Leisingera aquaemixtae]|uniref:Uncharacterized protein n=1 Tax=Leisingera aquaemixtae TaxID=1396826 RepID=A0ABY5WJT9_9RHOB|nr:hypothetical protein [Leisingera aquaemixtae]UWQ41760.1 hypothetical protein K3718_01330 [Leisingera aquaemixtae]
MNIPEQVREHLEAAVFKAFPEELVTEIKIEEVIADADAGEIRITLLVSTSVDPTQFAESYFGLTGKVRRSLAREGENWGKFFPIITPSIGHEAHA